MRLQQSLNSGHFANMYEKREELIFYLDMSDIPSVDEHFRLDLVAFAKQHIFFLKRLHSLEISISKPSPESLRRYRDLWLPLVHRSLSVKLIPPPDIAWLWHCHRLAPFRYVAYCKAKFGGGDGSSRKKILEANPPFALQTDEFDTEDERRTREAWKDHYPNEVFLLDPTSINESCSSSWILDGFDLLASTRRQATFLWQISDPCFQDPAFLKQGLQNYYKFLKLNLLATHMLVPTYQIDLLWHTHILSSLKKYAKDCKRIIGMRMDHDDGFNDRTEGGALDVAFTKTAALWQNTYQESYFVAGGMYRGEPPKEYFHRTWSANSTSKLLTGDTIWKVANVPGAASFNKDEWTDINGITLDGKLAFVPSDENVNPRKDDYVFGKNSQGIGYYHISTREGYKLLMERTQANIRYLKSSLAVDQACTRCWTCGMKARSVYGEDVEELLEAFLEAQQVIEARAQASKPTGVVGIPSPCCQDTVIFRRYYLPNSQWLVPQICYDAGGGCGGRIFTPDSGGGKQRKGSLFFAFVVHNHLFICPW